MSSNKVLKEIFMRRISIGVAVALITFVLGSSTSAFWNIITGGPHSSVISYSYQHSAPRSSDIPDSIGEAEIHELYRQYAIAQTNHDAAFFERVEADTFILTSRYDGTRTRAQAIEAMHTWSKDVQYSNRVLDIQLFGDTAFVKMEMETTYPTTEYGSNWRWVDVLKKQNGSWQILSSTEID